MMVNLLGNGHFSAFRNTVRFSLRIKRATFSERPLNRSKASFSCASDPQLEPRVICFDLETTGFQKGVDRIVEIAAQDGHGGPMSRMSSLVNPEMRIGWWATQATQIYDHMVNKPEIPK